MSDFPYHLLEGKKVLITGGLGFIGSSIARRCVELGTEVTILDACLEPYGWNFANIEDIREKVQVVKGDVRDRKLVEKLVENKEIIFHMAAQVGREISMEEPRKDTEINCLGTLHLLESVRKMSQPTKVIYAGSRGQTGEPRYLPVDEKHPDNPTDIYGINKLAAEKYLLLYNWVYNIPVVSLRLNNVYGPRCQMHAGFYGILNWFMSNCMQDKPITVYGDGSQTRDYVYIDDTVDAFIRVSVSDKANGEMFFVGSGRETVFLDMVKEIVRVVGRGEVQHIAFPASREKIDIMKFVVTVEKLKRFVHWEPRVDLSEGIEKTYDFYKKNLQKYLK
ncbi:MAG: SDR family NAD(P)-dependent oxidoreductase [bacterium]